jgi:hypothetical protein
VVGVGVDVTEHEDLDGHGNAGVWPKKSRISAKC